MIAEINDTIAKYRDYAQKLKDLLMDTKSEWIFVPRTKTKVLYFTRLFSESLKSTFTEVLFTKV